MKNLVKSALLFVAAAAAFTACNKEGETSSTNVGEKVSVKFYAQVNQVETKATLTPDEADKVFTAAWENGDQMKIVAAGDNYLDEGTATWNGEYFDTDLTEDETRGTWEYLGYYPSDENIEFGSSRVQNGDSYISKYDIMSGTAKFENALLGKNEKDQPMTIEMNRLTSILYFHLQSDLDADITSATLTIEGGEIAADNVKISEDAVTVVEGGSNTITLTFAEGTAPNAKDFHLWFNILPVQATKLTLTVNTAEKTVTLTNTKGKNYAAGKLNKIVKSSLAWDNQAYKYVKVNSTSEVSNGAYLIVYETGSLAFNGGLETLDASKNTIAVEIKNDEILASETVDAARFVITKNDDAYFIMANNESYIGRGTNTNGLDVNANGLANTITVEEGNALIAGTATNPIVHLRYNKTSGQERFRYFKDNNDGATQEAIALYKYNGTVTIKQSADLSYSETEFEITVGDAFTAPALNNPHSVTVKYESDNTEVATVDTATGVVSLTGTTGTATITASFEGDDTYYAGSANYTITVKAVPVVMSTLAELKDFSTETEQETEINFQNVLVTWTNGTNAYIEDETAGMYVFGGATSDLAAGDVLNGLTKVKVKVYNGQNEISGVTGTALDELKTGTSDVTATTVTLAQAISEQGLANYENMRVQINNTTIAVDGSKKYLQDENGNKIQIYPLSKSGADISSLNAGDEITSAVGYPMNFKSETPELVIVSNDDLVIKKAPVVKVTDIPTENISADGAEVSVKYSVENPVTGVSVTPTTNVNWINSFEVSAEAISFVVDANSGDESEERTGTVTVAYEGAVSYTFDIVQNGNKKDTKKYYVKVTSTDNLTDGDYLIVYEDGNIAMNGGLTDKLDAVSNSVEVTISNGKIEQSTTIDAASFTYDATAKTFKGAGGLYMGQTSDANGLASSATTAYTNTVSFDTDGNVNIVGSGGAYLRYNAANNQTRFRYYKSSSYTGQKAIQLYKKGN